MTRVGLLAAVCLLVACGPGTNPVANLTPSSGASVVPTATALPTVAPGACDTTHPCLALVTLRGSNQIVIRDISDIDHPKTVHAFAELSDPMFVSGDEISYIDYAKGQLVRMATDGSATTTVAESTQFAGYVDWTADGTSVIYLASGPDSQTSVHTVKGNADRVFSSVPSLPGVGCESVVCPAADSWDVRLQYSPDDRYISYVSSVVKPTFRLWSSDGKLLRSTDLAADAMPVWAGNAMYFRDAKGVESWHDGVISAFLPGVQWIRPKASPDGSKIVYQVRDPQHWSHAYVVDTHTGAVRDLGRAHKEPKFLTSRYVWYLGEKACAPADGCGSQIAGVPSGKTYIYDLQTGVEYSSVITYVYDIWPHTA